jgi:hypothetical protein
MQQVHREVLGTRVIAAYVPSASRQNRPRHRW